LPLFKVFSAPKATVAITLSKGSYVLGETIGGTISISPQEAFDCDEVRAELIGVELIRGRLQDFGGSAETRIYGQVSSRTAGSSQSQTELVMINKPVKVYGAIRMESGQRKDMPFTIPVPSNLGPSYQGAREDGSWMQRLWTIRAVVAVAGRPDLESRTDVSVAALPPPPSESNSMQGAASAVAAAAGAQAEGAVPTQCPKCGAPITITQEDLFFTCKYCGNSITIGSRSQIKKHSMLLNRLFTQQIVEAARKYMDKGIFRMNVARDAVITDVKLRYLPFWVFPVDVTTSFRGTTGGSGAPAGIGGGSGSSAETIGKLILVGADMYMRSQGRGRRGMGYQSGYTPPRTVAQTFSNHYVWPMMARESMIKEIKSFDVPVDQKVPFDQGKIPQEAEYLGSEYQEEDAKSRVRAEVDAKQRQVAASRVQVLETVTSNITVGDGELIHAPVWFVYYTLKGEGYVIAVDGSVGKILGGGRPLIKLR